MLRQVQFSYPMAIFITMDKQNEVGILLDLA
jgi:hypothetical protein